MREQFRMAALFDNSASVHVDQPVHGCNGGETVCDGNDSFVLHELMEALLNAGFYVGSQRGSGLIQNQNGSILEQHASDRDSLALTTRQIDAPFSDHGIVAAA